MRSSQIDLDPISECPDGPNGERHALNDLTTIANRCGTDKGTVYRDAHGYTLIYEMLFANMRNQPINILEVGLSIGGPEHGNPASRSVSDIPSVRMWKEYFPASTIFGIDISDFSSFENEWFKFHRVDCSSSEQLERVVTTIRESGVMMDIIVDDGSHASYHQQLTILKLFSLLKGGGFYVIEDLNWQPSVYEKVLPHVPKTASILMQLIKTGYVTRTGELSGWDTITKQIDNILIFDEDYLLYLRNLYNFRSGAQATIPCYLEMNLIKRILLLKHVRHVYEQARNLFRTLITGITPMCAGRVALAVLQKQDPR
jgi:hypothetical protein